jgi:hypothetical protein
MKKLFILLLLFLSVGKLSAQSPLCPSTATQFCCEYVASITINGQTYAGNTGFSGPGYYDYTGTPVPSINAGDLINISYTVRTNGNYRQYFKFWFDFNGNGDLTDTGELVLDQNATINNTTQTFNQTFTVPTSVFNGEVYMRFIMVFSNSPTICGNYSYGNTFDFKTTITGAIDNFDHQINVFNSNNTPISNVPVQLWVSPKNQNNFSLDTTYNTDTSGLVNINTTLRTDLYDFRIILTQPNLQTPNNNDIEAISDLVLNQNPNSIDYYRWDLNSSNSISVSDSYILFKKVNSVNISTEPFWRYFIESDWDNINNSIGSVKSSYPGNQSLIINNPISSGENNIYLIRTGNLN